MRYNNTIQNNGLWWVKNMAVVMLLGCICSTMRPAQAEEVNDIVLGKGLFDGVTLPAYKVLEIIGQAPAGRTLDIKLRKDNATITMARVLVNRDGNWQVSLVEQPPGGPYQLQILDGEKSKVVNDIFIGQAAPRSRNPVGGLILSTRLTDDMHLQPGQAIEINGFSEPGRAVDVKLIKEQQTTTMARVQAGRDGQWQVTLPAQGAGGPFQLNVADGTHIKTLTGIIIGRADRKKRPVAASEKVAQNPSTSDLVNISEPAKAISEPKPSQSVAVEEQSVAGQIKTEFLGQQFDDSSWSMVNLTSLEGLAKNETLIARKEVHFAIAPQDVRLSIGRANQIEQIIINGQALDGEIWRKNPLQVKVPVGMFQSGDNVIALISVNQWDNTRFIGSSGRFNITIDQYTLELSSNWRVFYPGSNQL